MVFGTVIAFIGVLAVFFTCGFNEKFSNELFRFPELYLLNAC